MEESQDLTWTQKIRKWEEGINLNNATKEELGEYANTKLYNYEHEGFTDYNLWFMFREEFEGWGKDTFKLLSMNTRTKLRLQLIKQGVYIAPFSKRYPLSDVLFNVLTEEEQHEWTDQELLEALKQVSPMASVALRERLNSTMTNLAVPIQSQHAQFQAQLQAQPMTHSQPSQPQPQGQFAPIPLGTPTGIALPTQDNRFEPLPLRTPFIPATQPTARTATFGKEVAIVAKIYTEEQKYSGVSDSFDFKLTVFYDICSRSGLPQEGYMAAFPTMLKGLAQAHYYNCSLSAKSFDSACAHMRNFFEGPEYYRKNLTEWNAITLQHIITDNPEKSISQCLQLLIDKLCKQQHAIDAELRTPRILTNKLVTACQGIPACRIAVSNPSEDLAALINKLQSSIVAWETENPQNQPQTFFTDRRYHCDQSRDNNRGFSGSNGYNRGGSHDSRSNESHYTRKSDQGSNYTRRPDCNNSVRKLRAGCWVCGRNNCRSWKHSDTEQEKAKNAWKSKFTDRAKGRFANRFEERFQQYITECEAGEYSEDSEADNVFESLVLDIESGLNLQDNADYATATPTSYLTHYGELTDNQAISASAALANKAFTHLMTSKDITKATPAEDPFIYNSVATSRYTSDVFQGIVVDTGASTISTAGHNQFQALRQSNPSMELELDTSTRGQVTVQFGVGSTSSLGIANICTPIGEVQFHIVDVSTPFLLCLADMDRLQVYYDNIRDVLVTQTGEIPVVRRFGHAFLMCHSSLQSYLLESFELNPCYLTDIELRRLHRRFGHPSVERLQRLLDRAGHNTEKKTLEHLTKYCHSCQKHSKSPGRFRFTLRDDTEFNFNIIVDIMYISGKPILHVVDEATRFQAGKWLQNISAKHTWDMLKLCWIDTYLGPPDLVTSDAGKNLVSKEFKEYAGTMGIRTKAVPVEAHNSIGIVERYHGPLRRVYQIIRTELPDLSDEAVLQTSFKAINDTAGPDGLVPTLLVFGAYPRMTESDRPSPTVTQRANAIKKAMAEVRKLRSERQVRDALGQRNGPKTDDIHDLPLNSEVLVWREGNTSQPGHWDGPFRLLTVDNETCVIQLSSGPTPFRSTIVKPYLRANTDDLRDVDNPQQHNNPQGGTTDPQEATPPQEATQPPKRGRGRPRKYPLLTALAEAEADITIFLQDNQFSASRQKEITGLLEKGVFEITRLTDIPQGVRLFNSRFVDEVKNAGTTKAFEKSRLVVQAYNDQEKEAVLTQSPTIQRVSQRLILCLAALGLHKLYLRDISQAYVQSTTNLNREFYIRPPRELQTELGLGEDSVLKVLRPLYGVPEAGNHWFKTYHSHHINQLNMDQSTYDPCLLQSNEPFGIVGLQTDDTLFLADDSFAEAEQQELSKAKFLAKEREQLTAATPLQFNGGLIRLVPDGITLTQERQCENLSTIGTRLATSAGSRGVTRTLTPKDQYIAQRARGAYIASVCQPEASFDLSFAAQVINPTENDARALNKRLEWQITNPERGLKFVKLDTNTLQLLVFTDASFANNKDLSSQMGYIIALTDATKKANIIHWSSVKCKRVTRSVLASELYGIAHGFDIGTAIKSTIDKILQINLPLVLCTDSKSLYDCLVRLGTTQEKRLMIDVMCLRQAYERRLITEVKWIDGEANPADAMTKGKPCLALTNLVDTNRIDIEAVGWVERSGGTATATGTDRLHIDTRRIGLV